MGGTLNIVTWLKREGVFGRVMVWVCFQQGDAGLLFSLPFFFLSLGVNIASTNFKLCPTLVPKRVLITSEQNINSVFFFFFYNLDQERLFIENLNSSTQHCSIHYPYLEKTLLIILI